MVLIVHSLLFYGIFTIFVQQKRANLILYKQKLLPRFHQDIKVKILLVLKFIM